MGAVFADTLYWIALTNVQDLAHEKARGFTRSTNPARIMGHSGLPFLISPAFHGLKKSCLIREIPCQNVLNQFRSITTLFGGTVHQLLLHVRREMHFHCVGSFSENSVNLDPSTYRMMSILLE